jgi:NAD(P)-dependent dehydrogenase (short-subunit alcohol dehydrogenase family)
MPSLINITSEVGSIAKVSNGGLYFYRPSKAALNMAMKILSVDAGRRGVIVGLINPGMVATRMLEGANLMMSSRPIFSAEESVADMIRVISNLTSAQSGIFLDKEGAELPW